MEWQSRTELLLGKEKTERLYASHVLVAGLGGVGAYAAEMLVRAGVGELTIVDGDTIKPSNRNRQLLALESTEGKLKVEVMANRLMNINPNLILHSVNKFMTGEDMPQLMETRFDYVIDAIDTLSPKVFLIINTLQKNYPLISSMGAGGKMLPSKIEIVDISESYQCKLARMIRKRLNKFNIKTGFDVVFSSEPVNKESVLFIDDERNKKTTTGTISYMPAMFGLMAASKVIVSIAGK
ncbi:MAG: tRNA threonylcarbamoyladenosine dehydratase [Cytophagaceae bacterium]|jgi:tRNA A37 threonylcarbamoyladenosine dehydratase|nr:tRNA threonylcarbamoyladenosine dehydratase [Cytophagaceae bacterium]